MVGGATQARAHVMAEPQPASGVVADDLRERILHGEFPEDTALPPERQLVNQTGTSRTTVREALRILEEQGLVRIRAGRSGGAFVQRLGKGSIARTVDLVIRSRRIGTAELLETRAALDWACARLAALHRTTADLAALDRANAAIAADGSPSDFQRADVAWHLAVAAASHDELLIGFMIALAGAIDADTEIERFEDAGVRATTVGVYRDITAAIRDRDVVRAAEVDLHRRAPR